MSFRKAVKEIVSQTIFGMGVAFCVYTIIHPLMPGNKLVGLNPWFPLAFLVLTASVWMAKRWLQGILRRSRRESS